MKTKILSLLVLLLSSAAHAEKADSAKQTSIDADKALYNSVKDAGVFFGNIVLTRGSLVMKGEKLEIAKTSNGYQTFTLVGRADKAATFRHKSDNGDNEWIEGEGARIEYNDQSEEMKIFSKARLKRLNGSTVAEEVEGEAIIYDSLKEFFTAMNSDSGTSQPGAGRVKVVIQSREALAEAPKK